MCYNVKVLRNKVSDTAESMSMFISMYMELYALFCLSEKNVVSAFWADVGV